MEAASNNERDYYISKLGLTTEREKREFSCLFDYVLKTALPHEQNVEQFKFETLWELAFYCPEIIGFQTVLRKHFQQSVYIDLSAGFPEAEAEFQKCVERNVASNFGLPTNAYYYGESEIERHRSQMTTQKEWIREVNELRRVSFQKRASGEGEVNFKIQLSNHFPLHTITPCYEEQDIVRFSDELKSKTVKDFLARFPCFEEKDQLASWAADLGNACSTATKQILGENKKTKEMWERHISEEVSCYKTTMATFLEKHPLVGEQSLRLCHDQAKVRAEERLSKWLCKQSDWESALAAEISKEFSTFEAKWKTERRRNIAAYQSAVREDAEKWYREIFKSNTEPGGELNRLLSRQVSEAVARDLDKADGGLFCDCMDGQWNLSTMRDCPGRSKRSRTSPGAAGGARKRTRL